MTPIDAYECTGRFGGLTDRLADLVRNGCLTVHYPGLLAPGLDPYALRRAIGLPPGHPALLGGVPGTVWVDAATARAMWPVPGAVYRLGYVRPTGEPV